VSNEFVVDVRPTVVAAKSSMRFRFEGQNLPRPFRIAEVVVSHEVAVNFLMCDFKVGEIFQFGGDDVVPAVLFSELAQVSVRRYSTFDLLPEDRDFSVLVTNQSSISQVFSAKIVGRELSGDQVSARRRTCLGLGSVRVAPGEMRTVRPRRALVLRPTGLVVPSYVGKYFELVDVSCGNLSLISMSSGCPAEIFSEGSAPTWRMFEAADFVQLADDFFVVVRNCDSVDREFQGAMLVETC